MPYPIFIAILVLIILAFSITVVILWRRTRQVVFGLDEVAEDALKALYHLGRQSPPFPRVTLFAAQNSSRAAIRSLHPSCRGEDGPRPGAMACALRLTASAGRWS